MQGLLIPNSILLEVNLGTVALGPVSFGNQPALEGKLILGVEALSSAELLKSENNKSVVSTTGLASLALTFCNNNLTILNNFALKSLQSSYNGGWIRLFPAFSITWDKSFVKVLSTTNLSNDESVVFQVYYR